MAIKLSKSRALDFLNMTPFIDVVFILLIFFVVAARFANEDRELPVQLPDAQSAIPMTREPETIIVSIDDKGTFAIEGTPLSLEVLEKRIQQSVTNNPVSLTVTIRGDRRVPFQFVVSVMDLCRRYNVPSYKVTTAALAEGKPTRNE